MRQPVELRRRRSIRGGGQQELRERVGVMRIAAELGDEDVRGERRDGGWHDGAERIEPRIVAREGGERHVDRAAGRVGSSPFARGAVPGAVPLIALMQRYSRVGWVGQESGRYPKRLQSPASP